jgi:CBS domain containing-hemolysin-like protein
MIGMHKSRIFAVYAYAPMIGLILLTLLLVFLNGFFVAAEFAIVKVRASQLEVKAQAGNRFAVLSRHIVTHLDGYLAATQLGITLASLGLGMTGEPVVAEAILRLMTMMGIDIDPETAHQIALPVAFAIITVLHIVFGELAPKSIAIQHAEKTTLAVSYPLQAFFFVFRPFIWVLNGVAALVLRMVGIRASDHSEIHSNDELKYLMQQGHESGEIEATDYDIIKSAFNFSERMVYQVMVPRPQLSAINLHDVSEEQLDKVISENYSRIPCYEGDLDNITGVIHLKDLLTRLRKQEKIVWHDLVRPVASVPSTKRLGVLLKEFQQQHQQMAVVVNEYGGTEGIVTMEDILEELVGEIQDEYDQEAAFVEEIEPGVYSVQAAATLDQLADRLPHPLPTSEQYETLAGYLLHSFGRIPNVGEVYATEDYAFTVTGRLKRAITLVKVVDLRD